MKRMTAFALMAMLILVIGGGALALKDTQSTTDKALLVIFPEDRALAAGEQVVAYYIGQVRLGAFTPMDAERIALGGKPLDDALRCAWAEEPGSMELTTDLIAKGQLFQLTGALGFGCVLEVDYSYSAASGDDYLSVILELGQELPEGGGVVLAVAGDELFDFYPPGEMVVTDADSSDGGYVVYQLDIDGDGIMETLFWDRRAASAMDEDGVMHPLILSRDGTQLQTLAFFYDNNYTSPLEPQFIDLDGDGVYELILAGTGHNTYVSIYRLANDAFVKMDAGYYCGD